MLSKESPATGPASGDCDIVALVGHQRLDVRVKTSTVHPKASTPIRGAMITMAPMTEACPSGEPFAPRDKRGPVIGIHFANYGAMHSFQRALIAVQHQLLWQAVRRAEERLQIGLAMKAARLSVQS